LYIGCPGVEHGAIRACQDKISPCIKSERKG
jgi:hypothetical protein